MKKLTLVLAVVGLVAAVSRAQVPQLAVDFLVWNNGLQFGTYTVGFQFSVTEPVTVGALGVWDTPPYEFAQRPQVGLWQADGVLLTSVFVENTDPSLGGGNIGGPSPRASAWRFHALETPITLSPGSEYVVAAQNWGETMVYQPEAPVWDPRVQYIANRYTSAPGANDPLLFPSLSNPSEGVGYFGGNFLIVPEPATCALVAGLGLGLFAAARRFKK